MGLVIWLLVMVAGGALYEYAGLPLIVVGILGFVSWFGLAALQSRRT